MPWKRQKLRVRWSCGAPGCEHRFWLLAWLHGLVGPLWK
jgi:hypothetical protein